MTYFAFNSQKRAVLPPDPVTLDDFKVEDEWATTGGPTPQPYVIRAPLADSAVTCAYAIRLLSST
jgi:hypothetical protein